MTLDEARRILGARITPEGIKDNMPWINYCNGEITVILDGDFTADECEAIAVYMRATHETGAEPK